jgi:RNA recognition motif-containing protein
MSFSCCISDATIYVGGLDEKVTEALMWELFVQSGPVGEYAIFVWND